MILKNDFYGIVERKNTDSGVNVTVRLNADHCIYAAHFPGNPVTPGVCMTQIVKELTEETVQAPLLLKTVKNIKFTRVVNPLQHPEVTFILSAPQEDEKGYKVTAGVEHNGDVFAKMSLVFTRKRGKVCVIIPTYNNDGTLAQVIDSVSEYLPAVIVVNDGSTDGTTNILKRYAETVEIVSYGKNRGKGFALRCGFDRAEALGYTHAITIDADGQHYASDIPQFVRAAHEHPNSLIVGSRNLAQENMPGKNTFANRFSNFWFTVQTARVLSDTQTGYRLYPLKTMKRLRPVASRYEAELEILVRCAWRNIAITSIPIGVYYAPQGKRVTHFRPGIDFIRISILNTLFVFLAVLYGYPSMGIRWGVKKLRLLFL